VTETLCAVAVSESGEGEGVAIEVDGVGPVVVDEEAARVETASCAIARFVIPKIATTAIKICFIKGFRFQSWLSGCGFTLSAKPGKSGYLHKCEPRSCEALAITPREETRLDLC